MPKIKTYRFNASDDNMQQAYAVDIYYSSSEGWYAKLNSELYEPAYNRFEELEKDGLRKKFKSEMSRIKNEKPTHFIIEGNRESDVESKVYDLYRKLLTSVVKKRKVIIIQYEGDRSTTFNNFKPDDKFPQIQMSVSLTFCTEVRASEKAEPKYYKYNSYEGLGREYHEKKEVHNWGRRYTVVDDTEENRVFLINLYKSLDALNKAMKKFTSTPEKMLELISSKQNLLTYNQNNERDI